MADNVLYMGVRGVTDLMVAPGLVNLDFADIRTVMAEMGKAMMGTGEADGDNRAIRAAEAAISNPLLEDTCMAGARGLLINITGGDDMTLFEVDQAANRIREEVDEEANIIFGSAIDETLIGKIRVSVVATGIETPLRQASGRSWSRSAAARRLRRWRPARRRRYSVPATPPMPGRATPLGAGARVPQQAYALQQAASARAAAVADTDRRGGRSRGGGTGQLRRAAAARRGPAPGRPHARRGARPAGRAAAPAEHLQSHDRCHSRLRPRCHRPARRARDPRRAAAGAGARRCPPDRGRGDASTSLPSCAANRREAPGRLLNCCAAVAGRNKPPPRCVQPHDIYCKIRGLYRNIRQ